MLTNNLLDSLKVLDFTTRLPGPLSSFILQSFGATITKIENTDIGSDPFNNQAYLKHAPHFQDWYKNLNQDKNIINLSFNNNESDLLNYIQDNDIILIPENSYFEKLLNKSYTKNLAIIKLSGGKDQWRSLHDLNALALTVTFKEHCKNSDRPPYLPFAGINFAHYIASSALATLHRVNKEEKSISTVVYLKDVTELIFDSLYSELINANDRFLHDGAFPCYNIYKSSDNKTICLAAVEEKYWTNLAKSFNLNLKLEDRFDSTLKTYMYLKNSFAKLHSNEINKQIKQTPMCLTIVRD